MLCGSSCTVVHRQEVAQMPPSQPLSRLKESPQRITYIMHQSHSSLFRHDPHVFALSVSFISKYRRHTILSVKSTVLSVIFNGIPKLTLYCTILFISLFIFVFKNKLTQKNHGKIVHQYNDEPVHQWTLNVQ